MSLEAVKDFFAAQGLAERVQTFSVSSATVELAAAALGCAPERIAKTLSFLVDGKAILIVAAGDAKVDNAKYKAQFGTKAVMLPREEVESYIGHGVGGVCPFCVKEGVPVYLDASLKRFDTVFPAAGSASSAVKLTLPELEQLSGCTAWIDVCKMA